MSGEADGFFRFGCSGLIRAYVRSSSLPCVPGAAFPGCGTAPPAGRPGRGSRASSSLQVRSFPCRGPAAGHLMQLHSHRGGLQGDRDVRGAHIVHPVPVIDIRPREILVSAGNQQHRSIGRPGSIASGEALREPGMSFRIFASRIVICPLLGIVAGRSPACRFEQQCQLFFIDGTGVV